MNIEWNERRERDKMIYIYTHTYMHTSAGTILLWFRDFTFNYCIAPALEWALIFARWVWLHRLVHFLVWLRQCQSFFTILIGYANPTFRHSCPNILRVILRYSQSIENGVSFSHIYGGVCSLNSWWGSFEKREHNLSMLRGYLKIFHILSIKP